jgi:hypothetical protein
MKLTVLGWMGLLTILILLFGNTTLQKQLTTKRTELRELAAAGAVDADAVKKLQICADNLTAARKELTMVTAVPTPSAPVHVLPEDRGAACPRARAAIREAATALCMHAYGKEACARQW